MSHYIISPTASRDLEEISNYFASRNIEAGERFVEQFAKKCKNIIEFPNIGRSYAEIAPGLRGVPVDGYIILYRVREAGVEIVRVVSGYQDLESLFVEPGDE